VWCKNQNKGRLAASTWISSEAGKVVEDVGIADNCVFFLAKKV
jgi:hypothetical protein